MWTRIYPGRDDGCASRDCGRAPTYRLDSGGVASDYCAECAHKIAASHPGQLNGLGPRGASDEADIVNVLRAHKGAWQFRDGDWTRGSMAPDIAADEIMRLRTVFRANMLLHVTGATHAEIDAVLFPQPPEQPDAAHTVSND